jgi:FMN-dependent NADH-azoreductase
MPHLLHIDSSIQGERSVSRRLTARARQAWQAAHPGGTVTYRDLGAEPLPHLTPASAGAGLTPAEARTPEQAAAYALSEEIINEVKAADAVVLGLPVYNFGAPSSVKTWVDHLIVPGLSVDGATQQGLLGGRELLVVISRGGGYGPGTPREGWDHAEQWLPHGLALTGLEPEYVIAELTLAHVNPAMSELIPLADASMKAAEEAIDNRWKAGVPA